MKTCDEIRFLAKQLRLHSLDQFQFTEIQNVISNEEFLLNCLKEEVSYRDIKAEKERIKQAHLPAFKTFEEFDTDFQKSVTDRQIAQLSALDWIDGVFNLVLIGPPGVGKTHIALAVGNKAVRSGYRVFFATMDTLMHILKTAEMSAKSKARVNYIRKCDLLIIDELGYLPVSRIEANLFFGLISSLYEIASVVITSNKGFAEWADLLGDSVLATALLDRITHKCQVLSLEGEGWRIAHRKEIFADSSA